MNAKTIADYFLIISEPEAGDILSNLKLQKLIYYAQGFHLAIHNEELFEEEIQAWEHGPVVSSLYHEFKVYGSNAIPQPEEFDFSGISEDVKNLLNEIYQVYGQFSAWKLRNMTHEERPWKETTKNDVISKKLLKEYFLTQID